MTTYIIRRLILVVIVLVIVTILVFAVMRLLPGDPIRLLLTESQQGQVSEEQIALLRHEAGIDRPLVVQYIIWIGGALHGDLGKSILNKVPVTDEILRRLPITLHIAVMAFVIGVILGIPAGVLCAIRRGKFIDTLVTTLANIGITVPVFWLGLILVYFFSLQLKWLPVQGYTSPFDDLWLSTRQIIMPVVCLALFPLAATTRQTRSAMLDVIRQDYIRTAWSKGLKEHLIILRHALKNGLIPVVTLFGVWLSISIGGSVFIETVFNIPGIGRLAIASVLNKDYTYVQGVTLIVAVFVLSINLLVDLSYGWLDPRIRYG